MNRRTHRCLSAEHAATLVVQRRLYRGSNLRSSSGSRATPGSGLRRMARSSARSRSSANVRTSSGRVWPDRGRPFDFTASPSFPERAASGVPGSQTRLAQARWVPWDWERLTQRGPSCAVSPTHPGGRSLASSPLTCEGDGLTSPRGGRQRTRPVHYWLPRTGQRAVRQGVFIQVIPDLSPRPFCSSARGGLRKPAFGQRVMVHVRFGAESPATLRPSLGWP